MKPILYLVRGLPGSGKSTYARTKLGDILTLETDMFNTVGGVYDWSNEKQKEAICNINTIRDIVMNKQYKMDLCIVGVYAGIKGMQEHIESAFLHGYDVVIIHMTGDYGNVHSVPADALEHFKNNFIDNSAIKEIYPEVEIRRE